MEEAKTYHREQLHMAEQREELIPIDASDLLLGPRSREIAAARDATFAQRNAQNAFTEDTVGGIANTIGRIHGLYDVLDAAYDAPYTFILRIPTGGLSASFADIQQIMRETAHAVKHFDDYQRNTRAA